LPNLFLSPPDPLSTSSRAGSSTARRPLLSSASTASKKASRVITLLRTIRKTRAIRHPPVMVTAADPSHLGPFVAATF
jgi:hypothetical protein